MGVETKPTSFRLPDEALRQLDELQHAFSPAAKNRADCLTLLVALAHSAVIVRGKIATAIERMQRLLSSEFVAQTEIEFPAYVPEQGAKPLAGLPKPPVRVSREDPSHRRRDFSGVTRRVGGVGEIGSYRSLPFLAKSRQINYMRGAA